MLPTGMIPELNLEGWVEVAKWGRSSRSRWREQAAYEHGTGVSRALEVSLEWPLGKR